MMPTIEKAGKKKKREISPAKEHVKTESGCDISVAEEKKERVQTASAVFALLCCGASLYMLQLPIAIFCFCLFLVLRLNELPPFLKKHGGKIFMAVSALIVGFGIAVRIVMYTKCRALWLDEALLAESIVSRNWKELLALPLSNGQSAPVLYVIAVKAIGSVFGYSEFSLRIFSFFSFLGLLICEWAFLKKVLKADGVKTAFILVTTALAPCFVYYSNELKPYMSDAFFVILTLLLYAFYTQSKISLVLLTGSYVLILGFCSPSVFFIGGILAAEFLAAAFERDKKRALCVLISGVSVIAIFGLYYYWWMLPVQITMDDYWNGSSDKSQFNAFFIVLVILLYVLYTLRSQRNPSLIILSVFYALISWICPPAVFFVGGILAGELFAALFAENKKRIISIFISMLSIATAFGIYYSARPTFVSGVLNDFWKNPEGKTGLITGIKNIFLIFNIDSKSVWALVPFALLGIYSLVKQKNKVAYSVVLSMLFAGLASSIGKWPLNGRLWLFLPAIASVFSSVGFDLISKNNNVVIRRAVFCLFSAIPVFYTVLCLKDCLDKPDGMRIYTKDEEVTLNPMIRFNNMYVYTEEINPLIRYVKEHIKSDEMLYVYPSATASLKFKNGYMTNMIGRTDKNNIIYGINGNEWNENKMGAELDTIIKSRKAYLLFQHYWRGISPGLAVLQQYGTINLVLNNYDTPLFYFKANE